MPSTASERRPRSRCFRRRARFTIAMVSGPSWEAGALYIYDLGYQSNDRFVEASLAHHLLQRLKETVNPVVVASYGPTGYCRVACHEDGSPMRLERGLHVRACSSTRGARPRRRGDRRRGTHRHRPCRLRACRRRGPLLPLHALAPRSPLSIWPSCTGFAGRLCSFPQLERGVRMDHVHRLRNPTSLAVAVMASMLGRPHSVGILRQALNDSRRKTSPWLRPLPETNPARLRAFPPPWRRQPRPSNAFPRAPSPARPGIPDSHPDSLVRSPLFAPPLYHAAIGLLPCARQRVSRAPTATMPYVAAEAVTRA
jgi:hypothetical protein